MLGKAVGLLLLASPLGTADPAPAAWSEPSGVDVTTADDPTYQAIAPSCERRTGAGSPMRLVVFRGGRCALDRGLADAREQRGFVEDARVAPDGSSAVVVTTRLPADGSADGAAPAAGSPKVVWLDADHPDGRLAIEVPPGRWVRKALPLARGKGLALSTFQEATGPADFTLYGPDGSVLFRTDEAESSCLDIVATGNGAFLALDLAHRYRRGRPQRSVLVLDLLRGSRWTYAWSYGGDGEPTAWQLEETGVLRIETPEAIVEYDRNGRPAGLVRKGRRRP